MQMKIMQVMLVVAAILAAIGIAVALSRDGIESPEAYAKTYQPSGLMKSFGSLVGPPKLSHDELTDAGRPFPSSLRLTSGSEKTFTVAPGDTDQRRAEFSITGRSAPFAITYEPSRGQTFNGRAVDGDTWKQWEAKKGNEVNFVIFNKGGKLTFRNKGGNSSTITIRMEE